MTATLTPLPVIPLARSLSTCIMTCGEKASPLILANPPPPPPACRAWSAFLACCSVSPGVPTQSTRSPGALYVRIGHTFLTPGDAAIRYASSSACSRSSSCTDAPLKSLYLRFMRRLHCFSNVRRNSSESCTIC